MPYSSEHLQGILKDRLQAVEAVVIDVSDGCGAKFEVAIVSPLFDGKRLLDRHKLINAALAEEMKEIHALSIKKAITPEQHLQQQQQA